MSYFGRETGVSSSPTHEPPAAVARRLVRGATTATLATTLAGDRPWPYASLVQIATDDAGAPLLLISTLAQHTRNIAADSRVSVLVDGTIGLDEPLTGPRVSLQGRAVVSAGGRDRARYLARHPAARVYAGFGDFQLYRVVPERGHLVAGFGRITWIDGADLTLAPDQALAIGAIEDGVLAHMNRDHTDAVQAYAETLPGVAGDGAVLVGFDAEGCDLRVGARLYRLTFAAPVTDAASARATLARLAAEAKAKK